ncbi:MAG TPA: hypothetical protein VFQ82_01015 [Stellaceae bacterium]|nr:hypothetical protein [Stellaceae bacterium]
MGCRLAGGTRAVMYGFEVMAPFYVQTDLKHGPVFYGHLQLVLGSLGFRATD